MSGAALARVANYNIGDMIDWQRDSIRKREFTPLGRVLNIRLGIDSRAAYFNSDAWKRVMPKSKVMGLNLEWPENLAPWVGFAKDGQTLLFLNGIEHQPRVLATIMRDLEAELRDGLVQRAQTGQNIPRIPQDLCDYASGQIISRDGWNFAVCQPVEQIAVLSSVRSASFRSNGTFLMLRGVPLDGRHPALLAGFKKHKTFTEQAAHICHGMMVFGQSEVRTQQPKPWLVK
jgi:hypothetical protein